MIISINYNATKCLKSHTPTLLGQNTPSRDGYDTKLVPPDDESKPHATIQHKTSTTIQRDPHGNISRIPSAT